jgi:hypothetical protein
MLLLARLFTLQANRSDILEFLICTQNNQPGKITMRKMNKKLSVVEQLEKYAHQLGCINSASHGYACMFIHTNCDTERLGAIF